MMFGRLDSEKIARRAQEKALKERRAVVARNWQEVLRKGDGTEIGIVEDLAHEPVFIDSISPDDWRGLGRDFKERESFNKIGQTDEEYALQERWLVARQIGYQGLLSQKAQTRWCAWLAIKGMDPDWAGTLLYGDEDDYFSWRDSDRPWPKRLVVKGLILTRGVRPPFVLKPVEPKDVAPLMNSTDKRDRELGCRLLAEIAQKQKARSARQA